MPAAESMEVPTAPTAEHSILGAVILDPGLITNYSLDRLPPEAFYNEKHRIVWRAILTLHWQDKPIDTATLMEHLRTQGTLDSAGGPAFLVGLMEYDGVGINAVQYANDIEEAYRKRRLISMAGNAIRRTSGAVGADEIIHALEADLLILHQEDRNLLQEAETLAMNFLDGEGGSRLSTGFPTLDDATGGLPVGDLTTLAGRLSMGKSALAHHIAFYVGNAHVLTPDQPLPEILINEACRRSRVPYDSIRRNRVTEEQKSAWRAAFREVRDECQDRVTFDPRALTVSRLKTEVRRAAKLGRQLVVVDALQAIRPDDRGDRRHTMIDVTGALKDLARDYNITVLALSQISRAVEARESQVPQLADLSESKTIEDDSNLVLLLYRQGYYYPNSEGANLADVIVGKNKTGPRLTSARLMFDGTFIEFNETPGLRRR